MNISQDITVAASGLDATATIQQAIDAVSSAGGGRVSLSAGRHVSAGLQLKSDV